MYKAPKLIIHIVSVLFLFISINSLHAEKRALLVGINDYSSSNGKVNNLAGCVGDAQLIQGLLLTRFGFQPSEISTLFDKAASKKNILTALKDLVTNAAKDDVIFFYYAGHGITLVNSMAMKKEKTTEGILAADVNSPENSVIFDFELSAIYNQIIKKGATLTVIFDCCHSGNMTRNFAPVALLSQMRGGELTRGVNGMSVWGDYDPSAINKILQQTISTLDSSSLVVHVNDDDSSVSLAEARLLPFTGVDIKTRINVQRPHEIPQSRFLFIGASQGYQKSYEKRDAFGQSHGAFTHSLLQAYNTLSANAPVQEVIAKVGENFKRQYIEAKQWPNVLSDASRLKQHLLGANSVRPVDEVRVKAVTGADGQVSISGAAPWLLRPGYVLRGVNNPGLQLSVQSFATSQALARLMKGEIRALNAEQDFIVAERSARVSPAIRVYVSPKSYTLLEIKKMDDEMIQPALTSSSFLRYGANPQAVTNFVFDNRQILKINNGKANAATPLDILQQSANREPYFIYLPVSAELIKELMAGLSADDNVQFVNDPAQANFGLYLAYDGANRMVAVCTDELVGTRLRNASIKAEHLKQLIAEPYNILTLSKQAAQFKDLLLRTAATYRWLQ